MVSVQCKIHIYATVSMMQIKNFTLQVAMQLVYELTL